MRQCQHMGMVTKQKNCLEITTDYISTGHPALHNNQTNSQWNNVFQIYCFLFGVFFSVFLVFVRKKKKYNWSFKNRKKSEDKGTTPNAYNIQYSFSRRCSGCHTTFFWFIQFTDMLIHIHVCLRLCIWMMVINSKDKYMYFFLGKANKPKKNKKKYNKKSSKTK